MTVRVQTLDYPLREPFLVDSAILYVSPCNVYFLLERNLTFQYSVLVTSVSSFLLLIAGQRKRCEEEKAQKEAQAQEGATQDL